MKNILKLLTFTLTLLLFWGCNEDDISSDKQVIVENKKIDSFNAYDSFVGEAKNYRVADFEKIRANKLSNAFNYLFDKHFQGYPMTKKFYLEQVGSPRFDIFTTVQQSDTLEYQFFPLIKGDSVVAILGCEVNASRTYMRFVPINKDKISNSFKLMKEAFKKKFEEISTDGNFRKKPEPIQLIDVIVMGTNRIGRNNRYGVYTDNYYFFGIGDDDEYSNHYGGYGNEYNETDDKDKELRIIAEKDDLETIILESIIVKGIEDVPCLIDTWNNAQGCELFDELIKDFVPEGSITNLKFGVGNSVNLCTAEAVTKLPLNGIIEILFNKDKLKRPELSIVGTFVHEIVHATMFKYLLALANNNNLDFKNMNRQQQINYIRNLRNDSSSLVDLYCNQKHPDWSHEEMANNYIQVITKILNQYDNSYNENVYESIAWIGLYVNVTKGTSAWMSKKENERKRIYTVWQEFMKSAEKCN